MRLGPFRRNAIRTAYYDGVVDSIEMETPSPMKVSESSIARQIEQAARQGWYDGRAKRALRHYEFSVAEVLFRAEAREAGRS